MAVIRKVPKMALATPPPSMPGGAGSSVKKERFNAGRPRKRTSLSIHIRKKMPKAAESPDIPRAMRFTALRLVYMNELLTG